MLKTQICHVVQTYLKTNTTHHTDAGAVSRWNHSLKKNPTRLPQKKKCSILFIWMPCSRTSIWRTLSDSKHGVPTVRGIYRLFYSSPSAGRLSYDNNNNTYLLLCCINFPSTVATDNCTSCVVAVVVWGRFAAHCVKIIIDSKVRNTLFCIIDVDRNRVRHRP